MSSCSGTSPARPPARAAATQRKATQTTVSRRAGAPRPSSPFRARGATFKAAFKARTGELVDDGVYVDPVDGIYLGRGPGQGRPSIATVLDTTMDGQLLDPEAPAGSTITELGLEREGLRGDWLAVSAKMGIEGGEEEDDMAGVYLTELP